MLTRQGLEPLIVEALQSAGGSLSLKDINKSIWQNHQHELEESGDFFYIWQYELRWAGEALDKAGIIKRGPPRGMWHLR
jgi:hypothetical protein